MDVTAPDPDELMSALAALAEADESAAPDGLRTRVLDAALRLRPPGASAVAPVAAEPLMAFLDQVEALRAVVDGLTEEQWRRQVEPYPWTVHDMIGHLIGIESYLGSILGVCEFENVSADHEHLALSQPAVDLHRHDPPDALLGAWLAQAGLIEAHLRDSAASRLDDEIELYRFPFTVGGAVVAHTFELWTHADDIRRALGRPVATPAPAILRAMSSLSVQTLLPATQVTAPHQADRTARLVLTGPGGGTWALGDGVAGPDVVVVADVVDYCRMIARRIDPEALVADISGDRALALDLFRAGRLLAA